MVHARIQGFLPGGRGGGGGGGGVQAQLAENSSDIVFFLFCPHHILQFYRGCPMVVSKKTIILLFSKVSEGVQLFPGGPNTYFYRNPYNL